MLRSVIRFVAQFIAILAVSAVVLIERGATMCAPFFFLPLSCFSAVLAGPIVIASYQRNPRQSTIRLLGDAVARAAFYMVLILMLSLAMVNFFFGYGPAILPAFETCVWAVVLCVTAAASAAAVLALLASRVSLAAAKWGFRGMVLAAVLIYRVLPLAWTSFWYDQVDDWGLSSVAFGWWLLFAAAAAIAFYLLNRRQTANA